MLVKHTKLVKRAIGHEELTGVYSSRGKGGESKLEKSDAQATLRNLMDAGCDDEIIGCFCALEEDAHGKPYIRKRQIQLLRKHRGALLEQLHSCQEKIDCLDYLLYRLRDERSEKGETL